MRRKPKIIIILLNWNGKADTLECLESVKRIDYPNMGILVVDNGSSDGSVETFRQRFPDVPVWETGANLGFAGGNNVGIEWALRKGAEWVLLLNNDTVIDANALQAWMEAAGQLPKAGILGGKILRYQTPEVIDHLGGMWEASRGEHRTLGAGEADSEYGERREVDYVCGAAFLVHRSLFERIGFLEPRFFLFWEESDFCCRAKREGFEVWTVPEAKVWHKVSSSFTGGKPHMHYFWWRSRLLWMERNCSEEERHSLFWKVIAPEVWKMARHLFVKAPFAWNRKRKEALRRYLAGCAGVFDYWRGRFGNCPNWLKKQRRS